MTVLTEIPWCPPYVLAGLLHQQPHAVFLDSGGDPAHERARWSFLCPHPKATLRIDKDDPTTFWPRLRHFWDDHRPTTTSHSHSEMHNLPFTGGLIGLASYEAGLACEGINSRHHADAPFFLVLACTDLYIIDRHARRLYWASAHDQPPPAPPPARAHVPIPSISLHADMDCPLWETTVERVREFIAAGDIFQANLTMRWSARRPPGLDLTALYGCIRHTCPAPFGAFLTTPGFSLLSASVERFLSLSANGRVETRPIKGTAPHSTTPLTLAQDIKERAENIMITDLMRHDIGRVCTPGSVNVPELCAVERFRHVDHLVSSVQGNLKAGLDAFDLLAATLPPGSVTGAPKHRALAIIDALERSARGAYCGTLFRLGWNGALDSAVIIRSVSATPTHLHLGAGSGITWPSIPTREYEETCLKAAPLLNVLGTQAA